MFRTKIQKNKKNNYYTESGGFTLIETMISVALFLAVVMTGMGALLNASFIHTKSQDIRSIVDNLSFIMEDMSRDIRTGYSYNCMDYSIPSLPPSDNPTLETPRNCSSGGWALFFEASNGVPINPGDQWVYYINSDGNLFRSTQSGDNPVQLNSNDITFTLGGVGNLGSGFVVTGAESNDTMQPFVTIRLIGKIHSKKDNSDIPFSLQTSVSQRLIDIQTP